MTWKNLKSNNPTPRFLLIGPSYPFRGGIAHYTSLLFNQLKRQYRVSFFSFKKQYVKWLFPGRDDRDPSQYKITSAGTPVQGSENGCYSNIHRTLHPLNPIPWIKAGIVARKCQLILLPWWTIFWSPHYLLFLMISKNNQNHTLFLCHNVEAHEGGKLNKILARLVLKRGDGFILHSREEHRRLIDLLKTRPPYVVSPHPVYHVFNNHVHSRASARQNLGISVSQKVILFFGFIRNYKGLRYLLKALRTVTGVYPDMLLLIVGEVWGDERQATDITDSIKQLGIEKNTRFINRYVPNEDVELYFKASDFAVLPYTDGTGSGILQVCHGMDKPVVATAIGAFTENVKDGKTGFLVPPKDKDKLAEAIMKMYQPGVIEGMEKAVRQMKKGYEWQFMVEDIMSLYRKIENKTHRVK